MPRTPSLSFANFICRFGERHVLLDLAQEIVLPAFLDGELRRDFGDTKYFFFQTKLRFLRRDADAPELSAFLYGRFIKDTVLTRTQVFSPEEGLIADEESMRSAPSAFFVLILNNHKLVYQPETPDAPSLDTFGSTAQIFLRAKHRAFIDETYERLRRDGPRTTKKGLLEQYPVPSVEIMPLASRASIENFVATFETLTELEFRILDTNQEFQMRETYRQLREMKDSIHSRKTKLTHSNPAGLDKGEAIEQIHASAATGNQSVKLAGAAPDGAKLRGDNNSFQVHVHTDDLPQAADARARRLLEIYYHQVQQGTLAADEAAENADRIRELRERSNER